MGNLSDHYSHQDFFCRCDECKKNNEYKIHLGLVGALELLTTAVGKPVKVKSAFRCETINEKVGGGRKSYHISGRAAHVYVDGMPARELFKKAREVPEIKGLGLNVDDGTVHIDLRNEEERQEWVKENGKYVTLTAEKKKTYDLE